MSAFNNKKIEVMWVRV